MKYIYSIIILALSFSSCADWLDVEPKVNTKEEKIFNSEQGFKEALTGIYIKLTKPALYGKELTYGFIDQLAQRYVSPVQPTVKNNFGSPTFYNFKRSSVLTDTYTNNIWGQSYNIVANINNLIANIESRGDVIATNGLKDIIHGEALGLRAFIHFDLLRMFGPFYKSNSKSPSIPYRLLFNRDTRTLLTAEQVVNLVLADLKKAEELLKDDAMSIIYPSNSESFSHANFLSRRSKRMNKYAVKALMARVYMYKGDKALAKEKANEVINAKREDGTSIFQFVVDNSKDHLLSKELIFAISMDSKNFQTTIMQSFLLSQFSNTNAGSKERVNEIFDTKVDGTNDIRMREAGGFNITNLFCATKKYQQDNYSESLNNTIPLIRLAEMYYIASEATDDLTESAKILSNVRKARALDVIDSFSNEQDKEFNIEKEYRKEFYAEGQLWYYYKRKEFKKFQFSPIKEMKEEHYRFSLPDDEITFGNL